jgi:hypothetical protein
MLQIEPHSRPVRRLFRLVVIILEFVENISHMAPSPKRHAVYGVRRLFLIGLAHLFAAASFAQHFPILPVQGSPKGIFTLMQDSHSALWLGTIDDVVRFDGEHFYSLRPYGFPRETPNSFAEDSDGGIWIATQGTAAGGGTKHGALYRYQAGRVIRVLGGDGLSVAAISPGLVVASIATELSGRPAFGDLILIHKSENNWIPTTLLEKQANHLTIDHQGNLLFPCPGGWCEISRQSLIEWQAPASPLALQRHEGDPLIERVLRDRFGCMWFRAESFASYQCPADAKPQLIPMSISQIDSSAHLEETADGSIFMLVYMALGRPGAFHIATGTSGLPEPIGTAIVGKDGTIWVGAENGLHRFMYPFHLTSWDGPDFRMPVSLLRNGPDLLAESGGILKLDEVRGKWRLLPGTENLGGPAVAGPRNTVFMTTSNRILHLSSEGHVIAASALPNVLNAGISLAESSRGDLWLGHDGINKVVEHGKDLVVSSENLPQHGVPDMEYDSARDILWACDGNELFFRKHGTWGKITHKDGLPDAGCARIGIEENGDLWIGYNSAAVTWIRNPASGHPLIRNYTERMNRVVADGSTHMLSVDHRGWVWMGSEVMRFASSDAAKAGEWLQLDEQDGVSPTVANGDPIYSDNDGSVWFGTSTGIVHFSPPEDFVTRFPPPPVFVAGFSLGQGRDVIADALGDIPRNVNLIAHIGSLQFDRRNALHFRYRLLPQGSKWIETADFDLPLGKLRWGQQTLQVQAQLATGPWSPIAERSLIVPWPIWLTWPMLLLYGTGGTGLGFGAAKLKKSRRFQRGLSLPDLSTWRMSAMSPEADGLIGTRLDCRYEIGHILSVGGFATVVRARDLRQDGRLCAVKIFRYEFGDRAWIRHRFEQEISALEQLSHPNIVRITGHGAIDSGAPYLVMEFIQGHSLRAQLERGRMPRHQIAVFLCQIASALRSLHQKAIYHRDLKPENLMIRSGADARPEIVLIDFSIAIVKSPNQTFHGISRVAGTLDYMAPEQVIGYADASTDIYSLAKVLMEMITGLRWTELFPEATLDLPDRVRDYFQRNSAIFQADSIEQIVSAMAFDPIKRPHDVSEFAKPIIRDLEDIS